jgi:ribosomal protein S18 acetylase RimI-like enzyme
MRQHASKVPTRSLGLGEAIHWVHHDLPAQELQSVLQELERDFQAGRLPVVSTSTDNEGRLVAAVYFRLLSGNAATLGGLRCTPGYEQVCRDLLIETTGRLAEARDNLLIQAIVDRHASQQQDLLANSGFVFHTKVHQLYVDVRLGNRICTSLPDNLCWQAATSRSRDEMAQLLHCTFIDTLDCPVLNYLRSVEDVLNGFLDGRELSERDDWYLLHNEQLAADVGCLLLSRHPNEVMEIVYLGLSPAVRGRRLGLPLISRAIHTANESGCKLLVAGVDCMNWPALRAYYNCGFQVHESKSVFFRASDIAGSSMVRTASAG